MFFGVFCFSIIAISNQIFQKGLSKGLSKPYFLTSIRKTARILPRTAFFMYRHLRTENGKERRGKFGIRIIERRIFCSSFQNIKQAIESGQIAASAAVA